MNCNRIRDQLELYVLDGLDGEEREAVGTHLRDCFSCREQAGVLIRTLGAFKASVGVPVKSVDLRQLHQRAYAEIEAARAGVRWHVVLARAASLLILFGGALLALMHYRSSAGSKECGCEPWLQAGIHAEPGWGAAYPLVRDNRVFALRETSNGLRLVAFDKRSGKLIWETPYVLHSAPDIGDKQLVAWVMSPGNEYMLAAISVDTGRLEWNFKPDNALGGTKRSRPMLLGNGVCWTDGKRINLVNAATGAGLWSSEIEAGEGLSLPVSDERNIYAASAREVYAFDRKTGARAWAHPYENSSPSWFKRMPLLTVGGGRVLVARAEMAPGGKLYCHEGRTGRVVWSKSMTTPINMLAAGGKVFVRTGLIEAYDLSTASLLWSVREAGCSPLTISDNRLYVVAGQDKQRISAFDVDTGKRLKTFELPGSCTGIVVQGKRGFLNSREGILYSVRINDNSGS